MTTISLSNVVPGTQVVVVLPEGEWVTPAGWSRSGNTIRTTWTHQHGTDIVLTAPEPVLCGLCGLEIIAADSTLKGQGLVTTDPDTHLVCYRKCIEEKVSAPGEPGSPWPAPEPEVDPWVQPTGAHDAYPVGALVTYEGRTWRNTHTGPNAWRPGVAGWTEVTP